MSVNIYVGNLSYESSESQLEQLFGQYGEVTSVKIIKDQMSGRSKGFGFIEMADKNEANTAIEQVNGKNFLGRNIKVNLAKPRNDNRFNKY
ncbi:MAG: RNA-binding protein [Spirochaetae bacterium HGW-Spirochaetae-1]|jgi:RNA recognition motif-containing protein|nr:MAG: RNA-binding protein [Spirochaetae bacterium HGW-Spirochaetae-1]